ncbi:MAG: S8 family serine peptidase [Verrucomicrobia bacterium]|nr:S8 family serine peptidase [Verrucomicrobiota bacterium]
MNGRRAFLSCWLATAACAGGAWPFAPPAPGLPYAADHVIVRFKTNQVAGRLGRVLDVSPRAAEVALGLPAGAALTDTGFGRWRRGASRAADRKAINLDRHVYVSIPRGMSVDALVETLQTNPAVEYAEPDHIGSGGATVPDDPSFTSQWHHLNTVYTNNPLPADIRSTLAWDITQGSTSVVVAILDTGLATNLSEFAGRHVNGYDFANGDANPVDDHNHGTMVASVLGANANNGTLVAGVDWNCRIMPVKVLNSANNGLYSWWADGIDWAVANGAKVINLSAGGFDSDITLSNAIMDAIAQGVIFVTITHNDYSSSIRFPGRMNACITVGATNTNDTRASFSNYGSAIDLVAPGNNIPLVSKAGLISNNWWGTSFSAPQVAGVAALLCGFYPELTQAQACALLTAGADDQVGNAQDTPGFDNYYGWGRLNAYNTLVLARTSVQPAGWDMNLVPQLSWQSPLNASNRTPFAVERSPSATGQFAAVSVSTQFFYTASQTLWQADDSLSDSDCFRVRITNH